MPFEKGHKHGKGRGKGTPNKATSETREAYKEFVENNIPKLEQWMEVVAAKDPAKALDFILRFSEYFIPKLKSTELTGKDGGAVNVKWLIGDESNDTDIQKT